MGEYLNVQNASDFFVSSKLLGRRQSPAGLVTEMIRNGMAVRER